MPLLFQTLLVDAGLDLADIRVLRHPERKGVDLLALWRSDRSRFEAYQAFQRTDRRSYFAGRYWASFIGVGSRSLFLGVYEVTLERPMPVGFVDPIGGHEIEAPHDLYATRPTEYLAAYSRRLAIDWGRSREWVQKGATAKAIVELHDRFRDPPFPGFLKLKTRLSEIATLPEAWSERLRDAKGVYLLACPQTREHYVGKADGADGFMGRWLQYAATGHGGNVRLLSRDPSDYQVTILEVAGSAATEQDIADLETLWKHKLLSREMGLNAN